MGEGEKGDWRSAATKLFQAGSSISQVAKKTGVNKGTVSRFYHKLYPNKPASSTPAAPLASPENGGRERLLPPVAVGSDDRERYLNALKALLTPEERAVAAAELLQDQNPMVRLRALELAEGHLSDGAPPALVPIFALPEGTKLPFE